MPYGSSKRKVSRKFGRRFSRRPRKGSRRFSRKKFTKNALVSRVSFIPNQMYVKLPWTQITATASGTGDQNFSWNGVGITCPLTGTSGEPANGETFPLGLEEYAGFYQFYKVLGASIKIQLNSSGTTADGSYYCTLLSATGNRLDTDTDSNYFKLAAATTENLISYPGAVWKIMSQQNGSRQNIMLKKFCKTKNMLSIKDVRDMDTLQGYLPGTDASYPNGKNPVTANPGDAVNWFFFLRIDPNQTSSQAAGAVQMVVKIQYYVQLYGRDYVNQGIAVV